MKRVSKQRSITQQELVQNLLKLHKPVIVGATHVKLGDNYFEIYNVSSSGIMLNDLKTFIPESFL
jgi:hypothetical protein